MGYKPSKSTWLNPNIEYLFNSEIIEYDIRDAGFSLIKQYKLLPPDKIRELEQLEKGLERHIKVGMIQRDDKELSRSLSEKFTEIRTLFIEFNKLTDDDIISVKKDAIYTTCQCHRLKFGVIEFVPKHTYTSYVRFSNVQNMELYYSSEGIDVKGMSDSSVNRHRIYMLEFLRKIIRGIEDNDISTRRKFMTFIDDYKQGRVDNTYYLEFNNRSANIDKLFNYTNILIPMMQIILREIS